MNEALLHMKDEGNPDPVININRVAMNADIVVRRIRKFGFHPVGVSKGVFQASEILEQFDLAGFEGLAVSNGLGPRPARKQCFALYQSALKTCNDWPEAAIRVETDPLVVEQIFRSRTQCVSPLQLMIPVLTSDAREGISGTQIFELCKIIATRFGDAVNIRGIQACFGCIKEFPPSVTEVQGIIAVADKIRECLGLNQFILSLGGSVMLPLLDQLNVPENLGIEIRVGEAVLAGTVPGCGHLFGLKSTTRLKANVLQSRKHQNGSLEILIDQGTRRFTGIGSKFQKKGLVLIKMSSEHSIMHYKKGNSPVDFDELEIELSYSDMARNNKLVAEYAV